MVFANFAKTKSDRWDNWLPLTSRLESTAPTVGAAVLVVLLLVCQYHSITRCVSSEATRSLSSELSSLRQRHLQGDLWMAECCKEQQGTTFADVNAHHQHGIVERRIRQLQELACMMLIHTLTRWKDSSVTANLWPYAIRHASNAIKNTPSFQDPEQRVPTALFAATKAMSNPKHWKSFGLPIYVLDNNLQGCQGPYHK